MKRVVSTGAYTFIYKPFGMEKVITVVESLGK